MRLLRRINLLPLFVVLGLVACGGHSVLPTTRPHAAAPGGEPPLPTREAAWTKLTQSPGVAGKDYDPQRITVTYLPGATVPPGWSSAGTGGGNAAAASQSNPQLRQNKQFEPLTDAIAAHFGLTIGQQVYLKNINFASFILPAGTDGAALLTSLRSQLAGSIEAAVFTPLQHAQYIPNDPDFASGPSGLQWGHWQINCPLAWDKTKGGATVIIAVEDTGVRLTHQELTTSVINPQTAYPSATCDLANNDKSIEDTFGHGTFIAGLISAQMDNSRTIVGVAPQCKVLPIKIANDGTTGTDVLTAGALLAGQLGANVVNFSWGGYSDDPNEQAAVDSLTADGVLFVCAAGNDALFESDYPTAYPNALSVGSTDGSDTCSAFSNWGPGVDMAAPGEHLKSCGCNSDSDYGLDEQGTSFAAPLVAGTAGLLWSYKPTLTLSQVRSVLENTGSFTEAFFMPILRLDAGAALASVTTPLIPSIGAVTPAAQTTWGAVVKKNQLTVGVTGASNVSRVVYTLDLAPVGTAGPEDLSAESTGGGQFTAQFNLATLKNQSATLGVKYFSSTGNNASLSVTPLWIFNQRGDMDGDGVVGSTDIAVLQGLIGKHLGDAAFVSYVDSDMDGKITEADAAAVGYNFGKGAIKPVITAVTPLTGNSGSQLPISATVVGSGQLTFSWNFGSGAVPNTSTLPAPTVQLGAEGNYNGTVDVTSEYGSDHFSFMLLVTPRLAPNARLGFTPETGIVPFTVNFDASASNSVGGSIIQYDWSWDGDTTWEQTTTSPQVFHDFSSPGSTQIRVRVTDDHGSYSDAIETINGIEPMSFSSWNTTELGPWGGGVTGENTRVAVGEVTGKPVVTWTWGDASGSHGDCYVARGKVAMPQSISDWQIDLVSSGDAETDGGLSAGVCEVDGDVAFIYSGASQFINFGQYKDGVPSIHQVVSGSHGVLANIDGRPAILEGTGTSLQFLYASSSRPSSAADWTKVAITAPNTSVDSSGDDPYQLVDIGGRAAYQYRGNSGKWRMVFATTGAPGSSDWTSYTWTGDFIGSDQAGCMFKNGLLPSLLFNPATGNKLTLTFSSSAVPSPKLATDWTEHYPLGQLVGTGYLASIGGLPTFATNNSLRVARTSLPSSTADWNSVSLPSGAIPIGTMRLVNYSGLPAFVKRTGNPQVLSIVFPIP